MLSPTVKQLKRKKNQNTEFIVKIKIVKCIVFVSNFRNRDLVGFTHFEVL